MTLPPTIPIDELKAAYEGRRVLVTGHTGFKGSWLTLWLKALGAEVTGYSLPPPTTPSLFEVAGVAQDCRTIEGDVRERASLRRAVSEAQPEIVLHLAAQPLVRQSYESPVETLDTNVMGTANLLEAIRAEKLRCAVVVVTSDKCYENREWVHGYREEDAMGGHDVYSMSKGAAELVTASFRRSFFDPKKLDSHGVALASARAGNVIGGGDWAKDRIVPDVVAALASGKPVQVRSPNAVRPWQHVLEPLGGYLLLGARLRSTAAANYCEAFNFGPRTDDAQPVKRLVEALIRHWGSGAWEDRSAPGGLHEAGLLRLSIDKAHAKLGWTPRWGFDETTRRTAEWYRAHASGNSSEALRLMTLGQIRDYAAAPS